MPKLTDRVLSAAVEQRNAWRTEGLDLIGRIERVLQRHGASAHGLIVELLPAAEFLASIAEWPMARPHDELRAAA
jgi:hypothetical protein